MPSANDDITAWREQVIDWLAEHAAEYAQPREFSEQELVRRSKEWIRKKHDAGYSAIAEPVEAGGAGGTPEQAAVFAREEARYHVPTFTGVSIGFAMAMEAVKRHGTPEQYQRFGTLTHRGDITWCQLFSEPAAGSDLAALRTRAVRKGDKWVVNGQKVWSSWAHHADWGILIARTDPTVPKHKGLTFFVVDMTSPGVEVRPIRQITGHSDFNETFLTDVEIPDDCRIGAEGEGWACCMTVLATERNRSSGAGSTEQRHDSAMALIRKAAETPRGDGTALDSAAVRARLADFYVRERGLDNFSQRLRGILADGGAPPATVAMMKLVSATQMQQSNAFLMDVDEYEGLFSAPGHDRDPIFYEYLWSAAMRIAGGADEVLRNQLAERALGMPGEMRADKGVPFNELPG
ncbi:MAG: acyl-CoA dehydrogenase family protein [Pseudomonadota bacterium]